MYNNISAVICGESNNKENNAPISQKYAFERLCEVLFEAGIKNITIVTNKSDDIERSFFYKDYVSVNYASSHAFDYLEFAKIGLNALKNAPDFIFFLNADYPLIETEDAQNALDCSQTNKDCIISISCRGILCPHFILPKQCFDVLASSETWDELKLTMTDKRVNTENAASSNGNLILSLKNSSDFEKIRKRLPKPGAFYPYALETIFVSDVPYKERLNAKEFAKAAYVITEALESKGFNLDHQLSYSGAFLTALSYESAVADRADDIFQKLCSIGLVRPAVVSAAAFGHGIHENEIREQEIVYLSKSICKDLNISGSHLNDTRAIKIKEGIENVLGFRIEKILKEKNIMEEKNEKNQL